MTRRKATPAAEGFPKPDQNEPRVVRRTINSWAEFVGIIQGWQGFRNWCFRGQASAEWSLRNSLSRHIEVSKVSEQAWRLQESRIRRIFRRKSHLFLDDLPENDELEWLALMQHHGAPTRSMAYEFEYSWQIDVRTSEELESLKDPRLPGHVLAEENKGSNLDGLLPESIF